MPTSTRRCGRNTTCTESRRAEAHGHGETTSCRFEWQWTGFVEHTAQRRRVEQRRFGAHHQPSTADLRGLVSAERETHGAALIEAPGGRRVATLRTFRETLMQQRSKGGIVRRWRRGWPRFRRRSELFFDVRAGASSNADARAFSRRVERRQRVCRARRAGRPDDGEDGSRSGRRRSARGLCFRLGFSRRRRGHDLERHRLRFWARRRDAKLERPQHQQQHDVKNHRRHHCEHEPHGFHRGTNAGSRDISMSYSALKRSAVSTSATGPLA